MRWTLHDFRNEFGPARGGYLSIELNDVRIADVFPEAGMYGVLNVKPKWVIEQAQRIVDTMNAAEEQAP
jgi:hypothetical protein